MKKLFIVVLFLVVGCGMVFSQSITLVQPNGGGGQKLTLGQNYVIRWTASGTTFAFKITLWKDGAIVGNIGEKGAGNGTRNKNWTVGQLEDGSTVPAGTGYSIKVKEKTTTVADESNGTFELAEGLRIYDLNLSGIRAAQDLELKDIYYTWALGGRIVARVKSTVNPYKGDIVISYKTLPSGAEQTVTKSVDLSRGAEKVISLFAKSPGEMGCSGIPLRVHVDPRNAVSETNEENNILNKSVYKYLEQDGLIESVSIMKSGRYIEIADGDKVDLGSSTSVNTTIRVKVRNCGGTRLERGEVDIEQNFQATLDAPRGRCRSINESIGKKSGVSLSPGISRSYSIPVSLFVKAQSQCRRTKNEVTIQFNCGESGPRARNNEFKFSIK